MFRKLLDQAEAGDNVGILLRGVDKNEIKRGQVIAAPGTITPHTKFKAELVILTKEEGGRHTSIFSGYRPSSILEQQTYRNSDPARRCRNGVPGDNLTITGELLHIAMEKVFALYREGGRTVAAGVITEIVG